MQALATRMESEGNDRTLALDKLVDDMKQQMIIDGLMGEGCDYKDFKHFAKEVHEHKESVHEDIFRVNEIKLKALEKKINTSLTTQNDDLMVNFKNQEAEIQELNHRIE